ncbi:MAG TPA: nucleotidyltransferase domain-containing protein [Nitrospiria bacterium]|nr:nucleotidyltransferase domain-containing protein [Nitrospiria bacterium]
MDKTEKHGLEKERENQFKADPILRDFLSEIAPVREAIRKIILFGSRARGTHTPDSDYDLLLVVDRRDPLLVDRLYDAVMDVLLKHGRLISLKFFTPAEMDRLARLKTPFMQHVLREGVGVG